MSNAPSSHRSRPPVMAGVGLDMDSGDIVERVQRLDTRSGRDAEGAWEELRAIGVDVVPYLAEAYPRFRKAQGRVSLVFHAIRYARDCDDAFHLGVMALKDKASLVRYRACGLLAYSLRRDALPHLKELLTHPDKKTVEDATAAISAIEHKNHHLFVDRDHSGRSRWIVNEADDETVKALRPWYKLW